MGTALCTTFGESKWSVLQMKSERYASAGLQGAWSAYQPLTIRGSQSAMWGISIPWGLAETTKSQSCGGGGQRGAVSLALQRSQRHTEFEKPQVWC